MPDHRHPGDPVQPWTHNTIWEFSIRASYEGQDMINVHAFEAIGAREAVLLTDDDAINWGQNIINTWQAQLQAEWLAAHAAGYVVYALRCQVVQRPGKVQHRLVPLITDVNLPGTPVGHPNNGPVQPTLAGVIKWASNIAGRSHRGRTYVGGLDATYLDSNSLTPVGETQLSAYGTKILVLMGAGVALPQADVNFTVYSRPYSYSAWTYRSGGKLLVREAGPYDGNSTHISGAAVDDIVRVQRRREIGVGS